MDFKLYEDKKSSVKTVTTVHIGPYTISVEKYTWDKTFENESTIQSISVSKMLEASGVADVEALRDYMLAQFGTDKGYEELSRFITQNKIRCEHDGHTHYE